MVIEIFVETDEVHEVLEIVIPLSGYHYIGRTEIKFLCEYLQEAFRDIPVIHEPYRGSLLPLLQAF